MCYYSSIIKWIINTIFQTWTQFQYIGHLRLPQTTSESAMFSRNLLELKDHCGEAVPSAVTPYIINLYCIWQGKFSPRMAFAMLNTLSLHLVFLSASSIIWFLGTIFGLLSEVMDIVTSFIRKRKLNPLCKIWYKTF